MLLLFLWVVNKLQNHISYKGIDVVVAEMLLLRSFSIICLLSVCIVILPGLVVVPWGPVTTVVDVLGANVVPGGGPVDVPDETTVELGPTVVPY